MLCTQKHAIAQQAIPDNTLGPESSVVVPNVEIQGVDSDLIDGGAQRGSNLFHSFQDFNVEVNRGVYFSNPAGIDNILTRVTGGNLSNIDGTLGVLGGANLFLINPNGLVFGSGAQLDLSGSFLGSTAASLLFEEFEFSATNPSAPPVLTVNVPIGLQIGPSPGEIVLGSQAELEGAEAAGITLVGGEVRLEGGRILAPSVDVWLGGLAAAGTVGLDGTPGAQVPEDGLRADIALLDGAEINVAGNGGGSVTAIARNLSLEGGSFIFAGISSGTTGNAAGNIAIDATEAIILQGENQGAPSSILNQVSPDVAGDSGEIVIEAGSLSLFDGTLLSATTSGAGNAGLVRVRAAGAVSLQGEDSQGNPSSILSEVAAGATGNSGGIVVEADNLSLSGGALLSASTASVGNTGLVQIQTDGPVTLQGENSSGEQTAILSLVETEGIGSSAGVEIEAGSLSLLEGTLISATTLGQGDAGQIQILTTGAVTLQESSSIANQVDFDATGDSLGIEIEADSLSLLDGALISATTLGNGSAGEILIRATGDVTLQGESGLMLPSSIFSQVTPTAAGNSGGIDIEAGSFSIADGALLSAATFGDGDAGEIRIRAASDVSLQGEDSLGNSSSILSEVGAGAIGNSGGIVVEADNLSLSGGAFLSASTTSVGNAGLVQVRTDGPAILQGENSVGEGTGIVSVVETEAEGSSEGVEIEAGSLTLLDGAFISATIAGEEGNAGLVQIRSNGAVTLQGEDSQGEQSSIVSQVQSTAIGDSLGVEIEADSLSLLDGAFISATTLGNGSAGEIVVRTDGAVTLQGENSQGEPSSLLSQVAAGATGDSQGIDIAANSLFLLAGGQLDSDTDGNGNAGDIIAQVGDEIVLQGEGSGIFSTVEDGAGGDLLEEASGSITLLGDAIALQDNAAIQVDSQGAASGGDVSIVGRVLELSDNAEIDATAASDQGGSVDLQLQEDLFLRENSFISAEAGTAGGEGQGGILDIDARFVVAFPGNNDLNANAFNGPGGSITIETEGLFGLALQDILNPREVPTNDITVSSVLAGAAGTFELVSPEVDPSQNLAVLPVATLDVASLIDRRCALTANDAVGRFAVVGRGGLPPDPRSPLASSPILPDFGTDGTQAATLPTIRPSRLPATISAPTQVALVEARGWHSDANGQVWLMGAAVPTTGQPLPSACPRPKPQ